MTPPPFPWPGTRPAAVSLTYDDGPENNLDLAIPDLEAAGFRGTFYVTAGYDEVQRRAADWRRAFEAGHEIGNHTWGHPCRAELYGPETPAWIRYKLEDYTEQDIRDEIDRAADWLDAHVGPDPDRTFAYPCAHTTIGRPPDEAAYRRAVASRHRAARGWTGSSGVNDPWRVDLLHVDSLGYRLNTLERLRRALAEALDTGGWLCVAFHGIDGPPHPTDRAVHRQFLVDLAESGCYVAPVREIVRPIVDK